MSAIRQTMTDRGMPMEETYSMLTKEELDDTIEYRWWADWCGLEETAPKTANMFENLSWTYNNRAQYFTLWRRTSLDWHWTVGNMHHPKLNKYAVIQYQNASPTP